MSATRRLVAIFYADVAGYSRLTGADEEGTHRRVMAVLDDVTARIGDAGGMVLRYAGDAILATFPSVVLAVDTSAAIQTALAEREASVAEDERVTIRIGINVGDVIEDRGEVYGEGVNLAARLEAAAAPGGLCISAAAHDQVAGKSSVRLIDGGEQAFKNIARPVRVFRWSPQAAGAPSVPPARELALPDKPSIAVLPFTNMSGDPEQEYFSDGITEDIITELSRFRSLFVIARNSTFTFKGQAIEIKEVGRRLGVGYVLEGSVRKADQRVRVTAQLVEAGSGSHIWAERYDRNLEDIFAVQDELVRAIAGVVPGHIDRTVMESVRRKPPHSLTAYDYELRGRWAFLHASEGLQETIDCYEMAVQADPGYAMAHSGLGTAHAFAPIIVGMDPVVALQKAKHHTELAIMLDERNPTVVALAAFAYHVMGEHALTRRYAERAVQLNPNDSFAHYVRGCALSYTGEPEQALHAFDQSAMLEPYAPDDQRLDTLCDCYYLLRRYDKVVEIHTTYQHSPPALKLVLAAAFAQLGAHDEARAAVAQYQATRPPRHDFNIMIGQQVAMCVRAEDKELWLDGYRKAGLPV